MSKHWRHPQLHRPAARRPSRYSPTPGASGSEKPSQLEQPDVIQFVAAALNSGKPLDLLAPVSSLLTMLDPRCRNPHEPVDPALPPWDELMQSYLDVELPESTAVMAVIAALSDDDVLRQRLNREITRRQQTLPGWLTELHLAQPADRVVELDHVLGDGDTVVIGARLPGGHELTAVAYIEHNLGTLVKEAFVVGRPLSEMVAEQFDTSGDPDADAHDLDPADARARLTEAIERGAVGFSPFRSDTWPAYRPLVKWMIGLLPEGGTGYQRPEWDDAAREALTTRFSDSPFGAGFADRDHRRLLGSLLSFGIDHGPGDPQRWSPVAVGMVLTSWLPHMIVGEVEFLAMGPDLLRAFIRFCHHERGIRPELTAQTLAMVDKCEPDYQRAIRSPHRQELAAAMRAAMGMPEANGS
ncbi:MAG: hypothetical protein ACR2GH_18570 [Pseudonocardia sp.]